MNRGTGLSSEQLAELARRVRTARAYAGLMNQSEFQRQLRVSRGTVRRLEGELDGGRQQMHEVELAGYVTKICELTGVPRAWFDRLDHTLADLIEAGTAVLAEDGGRIHDPHELRDRLDRLRRDDETGEPQQQ